MGPEMKKTAAVTLFLLLPLVTRAQELQLPFLQIIDVPIAGTLEKGSYVSSIRLYPNGGVLGALSIGLSDRFYFGVSFGGENIIGEGQVNWNPEPGLHLAYRILDENILLPAVAVGYNSQGYGPYQKETKRYTIKSRGFYAVASKNYAFLGDLSFHGGVNFSLEKGDGDSDANLFVGMLKSLNPDVTLLAEYDFALNDNDIHSLGSGKGYLNLGVRWLFARRLAIQFHVKNILQNKQNVPHANREIKILYLEHF